MTLETSMSRSTVNELDAAFVSPRPSIKRSARKAEWFNHRRKNATTLHKRKEGLSRTAVTVIERGTTTPG